MGPVELVGALEHQYFAPVFQRAGTQYHVIPALIGKDLRVTHMAGKPGGIAAVGHQALLALHGLAVAADCETEVVSAPFFDVIKIAGILDVAGVVQIHRILFHKRRAGVDAVAIEWLVRVEHYRALLPAEQVGAHGMAPVLDPAVHVEGAVLEKCVVLPAVNAQAGGVVQPTNRRLQVELLAVGVGGDIGRAEGLHQRNELFQVALKCIHALTSSGFQMSQVTAKDTPKEMAIMMRYCRGICRCSRMPKMPVTPVPVAPSPTMLAYSAPQAPPARPPRKGLK